LISLINSAYKVTAFFKIENRINIEEMDQYFSGRTFLLLEDENEIIACIYYRLNKHSIRFNLLSVRPDKQGKGLSKILIKKIEEIGKENKCNTVNIQVVNLRKPLFEFYQKLGFVPIGTAPFPKPTKTPCHLVTMAKDIK
jgi:GNAT superfamily N-acetyltransferase